MRGELGARNESVGASPGARRAAGAGDDEDGGSTGPGGKSAPLPELDTLVARLPAEVRETLEELFRARFVAVKKLPNKAFQSASAKAPPPPSGAAT